VLTVPRIKRNASPRLILLKADDRKRSMKLRAVILALFLVQEHHNGGHPCVETDPIILDPLSIPEPSFRCCLWSPRPKGDMEKTLQGSAITSLEEDPTSAFH